MGMKRFIVALVFFLLMGVGSAWAELQINEIMANNGIYEGGNAWEWIEIKNEGSDKVSLKGVTLMFDRKGEIQRYQLPARTLSAGGYAVIFCIENDAAPSKGKDIYAPIGLSRKGGTLTLLQSGKALDTVEFGSQFGNISYGRVGNGNTWKFLSEATRGKKNGAQGYDRRLSAPDFSVEGGMYAQGGTVSLTAPSGGEIRYTLDGSEPVASSALYTSPIAYQKGVTCLRARAFGSGALPSSTVTRTYFVGVKQITPIISLVTDDKYLTNSKTGLLVPGNGKIKNYNRDWEYPISVEYYNLKGKQEINQIATFRVTGATSRKFGQKSLSIFARAAYGSKKFSFQPFANRETYTGYRALTLRAAGTESYLTRFRDALLTSRVQGLNIAYQESQTVVLYINGKYWGQYNLRERINKHFLAQFEGITDEKTIDGVTIIKGRGEVQQGTIDEWNELISFCKKMDLNKADNLQWVQDRLDVDSMFTLVAVQMIVGNADIGNQRYYRFPGGKWKAVVYDLDAGMQNLQKGPISYFNKAPNKSSTLFYHEPFAALIRVPQMRERFLEIVGKVILRFLPGDLVKEVDAWTEKLSPLMEAQIKRWPKCSPKSMGTWQYEVKQLRKICQQRPAKAIDMICSTYRVTKEEKQKYFSDFYQSMGK